MGAPDLLLHLRGAGLMLTVTPAGGLHVAPRSALTEDHRAAIRAERDALVLLLQAQAMRSCADCQHRLRYGTCAEPVSAGLLPAEEAFSVVWPPAGYGQVCKAFVATAFRRTVSRSNRLTGLQADEISDVKGIL